MPHEDYCYALERENHALNEKYESMRQQLTEKESQRQELMMAFERQGNSAQEVITELRQQLSAALDEARMANVSADEVLSTYAEEMRKLSKQLYNHIKREVMLRDALEYHQAQTRPIQRTEEALAATADLSGVILFHAEPCRDDGRCQYAIDHGAEGLGDCQEEKCCMPIYRAWEPK